MVLKPKPIKFHNMQMILLSFRKVVMKYYLYYRQKFGELSGLKLNVEKTKILLIWTLKGTMQSIYNIECVNNIKNLGIYVGHDKNFCIERNWPDKITKMRILLQR